MTIKNKEKIRISPYFFLFSVDFKMEKEYTVNDFLLISNTRRSTMPFLNYIGAETMSMGEKWATSGITTLIGLGMTFFILAFLIGMILLMRLILKELEKLLPKLKRKKKAAPKVTEPAQTKTPAEEEQPIDDETLDAIKKAVLNYVKTDDNVVIIKSVSRSTGEEPEVAATEEQPATAPSSAPVNAATGKGTTVKAPMPGNILKIIAANGKAVKEGEVIFVLEAMKMENDIVSPANGIFTATVGEGTKVNTGDLLAEIQ